MQVETSAAKKYNIGTKQPKDKGHEFKIPEACKVIAFSGVIEILYQECRLLNLQIYFKNRYDDNPRDTQKGDTTVKEAKSITFKELTRDYF